MFSLVIFLCVFLTDWILTQATDLPSQTTDQDVSGRDHGGNHEGHKLVELEKVSAVNTVFENQ
jgi:hypothetical protein